MIKSLYRPTVWVASIILLRDVGLAVSAIYYRWISLPEPKTFSRYWDFSLPSAEVRPTTISKYNTALQLLLVGLATANPVIPADISSVLSILQYDPILILQRFVLPTIPILICFILT